MRFSTQVAKELALLWIIWTQFGNTTTSDRIHVENCDTYSIEESQTHVYEYIYIYI